VHPQEWRHRKGRGFHRRQQPFGEVKIVFPPELKTGEWLPGPGR